MTHTHSIHSLFSVLAIVFSAFALMISACSRLWMTGWQSGSSTFYGVRVESEFENSDEASSIDSTYTYRVIWLTVAMIALVAAVVPYTSLERAPQLVPYWGIGLLCAHTLGMQALYWRARQTVLPFADPLDTIRTVDLTTFMQLSRTWKFCYWTAVLLPLGFLAATALYLHAHFHLIPPSLARPGTFGAQPPETLPWTKATIYSVYKPLVGSLLVNLTAIIVSFAFNFRSRISEWGAEARPRWTYRKLLMSRLTILQWLTTIQAILHALRPLAGTTALPVQRDQFVHLSTIGTLVWSVASLTLLFTVYRSRPRGAADTAPDRSWKFGQYYFNPQDPALIVPTRFGIGHTLNLGQPLAWAIQITGVLAMVAVWAGPSYVSIPSLTVRQIPLRLRSPRLASLPLGGIVVPTNDRERLNEAIERLRQGDETTTTTIQELVEKNPKDLQMLNAAAHGLARSNKELATARIYAEQAVRGKEEEVHNVESRALTRQDIALERNLAQFWDTLGLVCHRQGDVDCAHRYLVAAWELSPRTLFATHLAHLEEEQGDYSHAVSHFRAALGVPGSSGQKQEVEHRLNILDGSREQAKQETTELPLKHLVRRSDPFFVDVLFENAPAGAKPASPILGQYLNLSGPALSEREKAVITESLPPFPFPDAGAEHVVVRARVTCLKDLYSTCSMRLFTPDEVRDFYRSPTSLR
jgi:uncharacterized membrane protein